MSQQSVLAGEIGNDPLQARLASTRTQRRGNKYGERLKAPCIRMSNYQSIDAQPTGMSPVESESLPRQPEATGCDSCQISCLKCTDACFPWYK